MWFLLLSTGAVLLAAFGLPAARRLPVAPPPEALVACYFLVAALARLVVRNARLAAFERKARREARRKEDRKQTSTLGELGLGVGRGALQAVGGDLLGAGISLLTALARGAVHSISAPPPPARERRRAASWERLQAATCIVGVGLVCAGVAWEPLARSRLRRAADAALRAGLGEPGATMSASMAPPVGAVAAAIPAQPATSSANTTASPGAGTSAAPNPTSIETATATPTEAPTEIPTAAETPAPASTAIAPPTASGPPPPAPSPP